MAAGPVFICGSPPPIFGTKITIYLFKQKIKYMKSSDDYKAKLKMWAENPVVVGMPTIANFPEFGHVSFRNYEEMNAWKAEMRRELARQGGAKWAQS